jgi:hypothetical protein
LVWESVGSWPFFWNPDVKKLFTMLVKLRYMMGSLKSVDAKEGADILGDSREMI